VAVEAARVVGLGVALRAVLQQEEVALEAVVVVVGAVLRLVSAERMAIDTVYIVDHVMVGVN